MKNKTKRTILDLAFDITKANIEKGKVYKKKNYVSNKNPKPKIKSKNHVFKTATGFAFHVRGNMSGKAFKNLIEKNSENIDDFLSSDKQIMKL